MNQGYSLSKFRYNYIWFMLALSVLLCGMYAERVCIHSSLCEDKTAIEVFQLSTQEYDVVQEDLLPADVLTKQTDIVPIRNTKRESLRVYMRILMNLMLVSILPQVLLLSSEIMEKNSFFRNLSHDFIISFIHQKDGEKDN